ncbi:potassium channel subfamily K member 15 [Galendromus occidentalis]|uniref:Potassium channel subfamily K member 15 n=1 Tax=Galendromus occidentalis TaxID=34638 RepID=A0AAJ6QN01_9ACAR|nr:potassium channel subfamily K member 15 [Galendromus occidentalis]
MEDAKSEISLRVDSKVTEGKSRGAKFRQCVKVFLTHLLSQLGLCLLVVAYAVGGAFLFKSIEAEKETINRQQVRVSRSHCLDDMFNITERLNVFERARWIRAVESRLRKYEEDVVKAVRDNGYDGNDSDQPVQWTFSGALLYCITVITTIGYGHIAPKTNEGKVVTILYALVGIPLMLLCLSNIGNVLAGSFRFAYSKMCCLCIIPPQPRSMLPNGFEGSSPNSVSVAPARIPVCLVMLFVASYICVGAVIFSKWEGWTILNGAYFCFITLSTIGFGDYVPGQSTFGFDPTTNTLQDRDAQLKLIICCLYLIMGLAIIAMSFNLVQEEVILKCKDVARHLRLLAHVDD